jgi:hypothetical protein
MNRGRITINWRFDRKTAHRKFGYKKYTLKPSKKLEPFKLPPHCGQAALCTQRGTMTNQAQNRTVMVNTMASAGKEH